MSKRKPQHRRGEHLHSGAMLPLRSGSAGTRGLLHGYLSLVCSDLFQFSNHSPAGRCVCVGGLLLQNTKDSKHRLLEPETLPQGFLAPSSAVNCSEARGLL